MKKLLIVLGLLILAGCATKPPQVVKKDPYEKYKPWRHYATSVDNVGYLAYGKRQVGNDVYRVWQKDTKDPNLIQETIIDCNSQESMIIKSTDFNDNGVKVYEQTWKGAIFRKASPGTVGFRLIEVICSNDPSYNANV